MTKQQHNWGKSQFWTPRTILSPSSLEELQKAILKAHSSKSKVRFAGSLHSLNALCATSDIQIQTDKLNRIISLDKSALRVKVEAGIKIGALLAELAKEGLSLPNQGYITEQSIGGAIATATHGSGRTGTLSGAVVEIELIDSRGNLHSLSPDANNHLFSAAIVNLGCLGAIYSLTLKCIPLKKLHLEKVKMDLETTLNQLSDLLNRYEYFQFIINPYGNETIVWKYHKTEEKPRNRFGYKWHRMLVKILAVCCFDIIPIPWWLMPSMIQLYLIASPLKSSVDVSYKLLSPADEGHYIEEEIAVPFERFKEALEATRKIINKHGANKNRPVAVILIRFANADSYGYLSPAFSRQTAYISLIAIVKEGYKELFREFETSLYPFEGKPHWGKANFLSKERFSLLYRENYNRFLEACKELDPDRMFSNDYIEKLLDPDCYPKLALKVCSLVPDA